YACASARWHGQTHRTVGDVATAAAKLLDLLTSRIRARSREVRSFLLIAYVLDTFEFLPPARTRPSECDDTTASRGFVRQHATRLRIFYFLMRNDVACDLHRVFAEGPVRIEAVAGPTPAIFVAWVAPG